ncbi:dipeptidyl aminopeptidase/acylaminoacyl peptidase [Sphingomonas vulcanisoli]|uniref:Dipeptidyl aminopeptidase/acylaminoacyl peptidase n=1 Tax=Sphingomonas vulcanisoli TaxID=1658060 RepID=A0ABX0TSI9_9SPHN|nr:alpha/beta hydrolase [Sphingomonas vulcanisoli]NIJ06760.1 dipeptidyl aminopeptidase/acylaminoacyl peptidase [Sphingomonas vulcanisoli]
MALFEYFPNYVWNLSVSIALESGAKIGEIIDMCAPIRDAAARGEDSGTAAFMAEWSKMADKLAALATEDKAKGRLFSAGDKLKRAALYYQMAERMQGHGHPGREETYAKALDAFTRGTAFAGDNVERVEIPYEGKTLSGLWTRGAGEGPRPAVVYCNGLDSTKELIFFSWLPHALAKRGISCLCVDQPGTGEALRLQGLPARPDSEAWASAWVDWLETQGEVHAKAIGMTGLSLGGHYAPRAVAFEPRFASGAVWGANHDWAEVQQKRMRREGENPVPHYWSHVWWVFGAKSQADFLEKAKGMTLDGIMDRITVPFLVTHGESDRQIGLDYAHRSYDQLVNSPRRELKIFTAREGGVEHVGADNMSFGREYISDWFAETLGGRTA